MKTALNLDDLLLARAKRCAARDGVTLTRFVEDALRAKLAEDDRPKPPFELELLTICGLAPPDLNRPNPPCPTAPASASPPSSPAATPSTPPPP